MARWGLSGSLELESEGSPLEGAPRNFTRLRVRNAFIPQWRVYVIPEGAAALLFPGGPGTSI